MKTKRHGSVHSVRSIQPVAYAGGRMKTSRLQSELTTITFMTFFLKKKTSANTICTSDRASEDWVSSTNTVQVVLMRKTEAHTNVP